MCRHEDRSLKFELSARKYSVDQLVDVPSH